MQQGEDRETPSKLVKKTGTVKTSHGKHKSKIQYSNTVKTTRGRRVGMEDDYTLHGREIPVESLQRAACRRQEHGGERGAPDTG